AIVTTFSALKKRYERREMMTAGTWFADVSFIAATAISDEHLDEIIDALAPHGGAVSLSPDTNAGTISVAFDADDVMDASRIATTIAEDNIGSFSTIDRSEEHTSELQ